jgi:hypothetical protein
VSTVLAPYPDIELVLMDLLDPKVAGPVVTALPATTINPPLTQVERIGGTDNGVTDRPRVRVTSFGATRQLAWRSAREIQQILAAAPGTLITGPNVTPEYPGGVMLDRVATATGAKQIPELGRDARQVEVVYEVDLRRPWW